MTEDVKIEIIEKTLRPVYGIRFSDEPTTPYNSKLGGMPYWPAGMDYPKEMLFLAQVNLEELPDNREFPAKGILQFFIPDDEELGFYGEHKVIFHKDIKESVIVKPGQSEFTPIIKPGKISFDKYMEPISYGDYRFPVKDHDYEDADFYGNGSKLLGYPDFTQYDPRESAERYDTLLFQLDSDKEWMMWGDMGIANFFINKDDLAKGDFSDTLYHWDCC